MPQLATKNTTPSSSSTRKVTKNISSKVVTIPSSGGEAEGSSGFAEGRRPSLQVVLHRPSPEEAMIAFKKVDINGSNKLSLTELEKGVECLWPDYNNKPAIMRSYKAADANASGLVSRKEFYLFLLFIQVFDTAWRVFSQLDLNGDRRLTKKEFLLGRPAMKQFGVDIPESDMDAAFECLDANQGKFVLFEEFCAVYASEAIKREKLAAGFEGTYTTSSSSSRRISDKSPPREGRSSPPRTTTPKARTKAGGIGFSPPSSSSLSSSRKGLAGQSPSASVRLDPYGGGGNQSIRSSSTNTSYRGESPRTSSFPSSRHNSNVTTLLGGGGGSGGSGRSSSTTKLPPVRPRIGAGTAASARGAGNSRAQREIGGGSSQSSRNHHHGVGGSSSPPENSNGLSGLLPNITRTRGMGTRASTSRGTSGSRGSSNRRPVGGGGGGGQGARQPRKKNPLDGGGGGVVGGEKLPAPSPTQRHRREEDATRRKAAAARIQNWWKLKFYNRNFFLVIKKATEYARKLEQERVASVRAAKVTLSKFFLKALLKFRAKTAAAKRRRRIHAAEIVLRLLQAKKAEMQVEVRVALRRTRAVLFIFKRWQNSKIFARVRWRVADEKLRALLEDSEILERRQVLVQEKHAWQLNVEYPHHASQTYLTLRVEALEEEIANRIEDEEESYQALLDEALYGAPGTSSVASIQKQIYSSSATGGHQSSSSGRAKKLSGMMSVSPKYSLVGAGEESAGSFAGAGGRGSLSPRFLETTAVGGGGGLSSSVRGGAPGRGSLGATTTTVTGSNSSPRENPYARGASTFGSVRQIPTAMVPASNSNGSQRNSGNYLFGTDVSASTMDGKTGGGSRRHTQGGGGGSSSSLRRHPSTSCFSPSADALISPLTRMTSRQGSLYGGMTHLNTTGGRLGGGALSPPLRKGDSVVVSNASEGGQADELPLGGTARYRPNTHSPSLFLPRTAYSGPNHNPRVGGGDSRGGGNKVLSMDDLFMQPRLSAASTPGGQGGHHHHGSPAPSSSSVSHKNKKQLDDDDMGNYKPGLSNMALGAEWAQWFLDANVEPAGGNLDQEEDDDAILKRWKAVDQTHSTRNTSHEFLVERGLIQEHRRRCRLEDQWLRLLLSILQREEENRVSVEAE